ncbi:MAG: caspase family protein [Byssovorax sp.]
MTTNTRAHAVLIGVDDYSTYDATNKHNLLGCVNDVRAFWDVCVTSGFAPENIHVLTNPPIDPAELGGLAQNFQTATRGNILAQQETLLARLRADSRAVGLLAYSGHGAWIDDASEDSAVICPSDFWMDSGRPNNDIPVHKLWHGAGSNLTVVLDCCHSGGRSRQASHPITPRDPHRKHLPTGRAQARHEAKVASTSNLPGQVIPGKSASSLPGSTDRGLPARKDDHEAFRPVGAKALAQVGLLPIGSAVPLTLTTRALKEADLAHSPYRNTARGTSARILAACDVHESAHQTEFAGRFHGAFTWAVTSTVGQWLVEEASDGAIRSTIGCGSVKRYAASLLQVFAFRQTPVLHPPSAADLPFFGLAGPISDTPTGAIYALEINPEVKTLKLSLTGDGILTDVLSKIEIVEGTEFWSLGDDFMSELSGASAEAHTGLGFRTSASVPVPSSPITTFRMPTSVNWGTAVPAPTGAAFYSMAGAGPAVVVLGFEIDKSVSPARMIGIHWYQGVVDGTPQTYALTLPGRDFAFANEMPTPPARLTWFHAFVTPL